jgi:hypothetical protein
MLNRLKDKLDRIERLQEQELWNYAVLKNYKLMDYIRKLINEQLDKGIDADGDIIGEYSFATEIISEGRKLEGDPFTLKDKGIFRASFVVVGGKNNITIYANGDKTSNKKGRLEKINLIDLYSVRIIELTNDNLNKIREIIRNEYLIYVRKNILSFD